MSKLYTDNPEQYEKAAWACWLFILRRDGLDRPEGSVGRDGYWLPNNYERQACCERVSDKALYAHTFTLTHAAHLYHTDPKLVRKMWKQDTRVAKA